MHRVARADRRESKQPLIGSRYALLLRSGVGAPTGLSSVVPNAATRRIVVTTTVVAAAAALAPSRDTPRRASWPAVSVWYRPQLQLHDQQTTYRLFTTVLARHSSTAKQNERRIPRLLGRSSLSGSPFFSFAFRSRVDRRVHSDPLRLRGTISALEFRSSRNENQIRPCEESPVYVTMKAWRRATTWRRGTCRKHDLSQTDDAAIPHRWAGLRAAS